mmetsp:Transcript_62555/g.71765  ORF Transcript_62555/g.71765 Transcript_62555/m.71765 type:complete len:94 (+) Transcript_62555:1224-1505(+)
MAFSKKLGGRYSKDGNAVNDADFCDKSNLIDLVWLCQSSNENFLYFTFLATVCSKFCEGPTTDCCLVLKDKENSIREEVNNYGNGNFLNSVPG